MLLIEFEARPEPRTAAAARFRGAFIRAWVNGASCEDAIASVERDLEPEWRRSSPAKCNAVSRDEITESAIEYFEQALIDQQVIVMDTYLLEEVSGA